MFLDTLILDATYVIFGLSVLAIVIPSAIMIFEWVTHRDIFDKDIFVRIIAIGIVTYAVFLPINIAISSQVTSAKAHVTMKH